MATINGTSGNDTLNGTSSADTIYGYDGDDYIIAGGAADTSNGDIIYGGNGNDTIVASGGSGSTGNTYYGDAGEDVFVWNMYSHTASIYDSSGTSDTILFGEGFTYDNISISLYGTNHIRIDADGANRLVVRNQMSTGTIEFLSFADGSTYSLVGMTAYSLIPTENDDLISLSAIDDDFNALGGNDTVYGNVGDDTINGGAGNDIIFGGLGNDTLDGGDGSDTANYSISTSSVSVKLQSNRAYNDGQGGVDRLFNFENITGSNFDDYLGGKYDANIISGGAGNDTIEGYGGGDTLSGDAGDDYIIATGGDTINGGDDYDKVDFTGEDALGYGVTVNMRTGSLSNSNGDTGSISQVEQIIGSSQDDNIIGNGSGNQLNGGAGDDTIDGDNGNDFLYGDQGNDTIYGGLGNDFIDGDNWNLSGASAGDDTIYGGDGNDDIYGRGGNDILYGDAGDDTIRGHEGNDTIDGGSGKDTIYGHDGDDTLMGGLDHDDLYGGSGADTFVFEFATSFDVWDEIHDFSVGQGDRLDLSDVLSNIGFNAGSDDITDFVKISDNGTHSYLRIDLDGNGAGFTQIARLNNVTGLTDEQQLLDNGTIIV